MPAYDANLQGDCDFVDALFVLQCDVGLTNVLCLRHPNSGGLIYGSDVGSSGTEGALGLGSYR